MADNQHDNMSSLQPVKSWYSALSTLHISPSNTPSNRISPLISTKKISSSPSVKRSSQIITTNTSASSSITHILKRMTLPRSNSSNVSKISSKKRGQRHPQHNDEGVRIYMKSPHAIANGQLSGTIVLQSPLDDHFQTIQVSLTGTEEVFKFGEHENTIIHHEFFDYEVLTMTTDQIYSSSISSQDTYSDVIEIPFSVSLSPDLCGTFVDSDIGSIKYNLKSKITYNNEKEASVTKTPILIYPNFTSTVYNPSITESNIQVWGPASSASVLIDVSLSHTIWTSGAPIYVTIDIQNNSVYTVSDLKIELVRKQNIYCIGEDKSMISISSKCENISETSLSKSEWWYPLKTSRNDHLTLAVETPMNQNTITNQNLINISFFVRILISSSERTDVVAEIPIILAHPISTNPPSSLLSPDKKWNESRYIKGLPKITSCENTVSNIGSTGANNQSVGNYANSEKDDLEKESTNDSNDLRIHVLDNSLRTALSDIIEVDTPVSGYTSNGSWSSNTVDLSSDINQNLNVDPVRNSLNIITDTNSTNNEETASTPRSLISPSSVASSLHSTIDFDTTLHESNQFKPLRRSNTTSSNKLSKMKRSFSSWSTLISRKMSTSTNKRNNKVSNRPEISSPIISNYSVSSCDDSVTSSPEPSKNHDLISIIHRNSREFQPQRSIMKFGQIKGPKRFGQQPGSLGDAGLDIRKCFNVATATEAIKSFSAEKVEITDDIPFDLHCSGSISCDDVDDDINNLNDEQSANEPQLLANYPNFLERVPLTENNFKWKEGFIAPPEKCQLDLSMIDTIEETVNEERRSSFSKYPGNTKRMLASSRHLMNLQKKGVKHTPKARTHLVLPPSSV